MPGLSVILCACFLAAVVSASQEGPPTSGAEETDRDQLAERLYREGRLAEARPYLEEALELRLRTLGEDHPETAAAGSRLAVLLHAQGDLEKAAQLSFRALRIYLRQCADLFPGAPAALERAHQVLLEGLDTTSREALTEGRGALRLVLESLNRAPGDSAEAFSVVRAAGFWLISDWARMLGDSALWRESLESAFELRKGVLPEDHLELARLRLQIGVQRNLAGRTDEAEELFNRVLAVFLTDPATDYVDLIRVYLGLTQIASHRGNLERRRELIDLARAAIPRELPEMHPIRRNLLLAEASYYLDIGDLTEALQRQRMVVTEPWERVSTHDRVMLYAKSELAETLALLGNLREAELLLAEVVETYSRILGPDHLNLQIARIELAEILFLMGRPGEALELEQVALPILATLVPREDPLLIKSRVKHASTLRALGRLAEARQIEKEALLIVEGAFSESDPVVLSVRASMAITLGSLGTEEGRRESLELNGKVLKVLEETLPAEHVQVEIVRGNQIFTLLELKRRAEAKSLLLEHLEALTAGLHSTALSMSPAEAEAIASSKKAEISRTLSMVDGMGVVDAFPELNEDCFSLVEQARCIGLFSAYLDHRQVEGDPPQSKLVRSQDLAERLDHDEAIVGYWRYLAAEVSPILGAPIGGAPRFLAFIVRKDRPLQRVDLELQWQIRLAVDEWRGLIAEQLNSESTRGTAKVRAARERLADGGERLRQLVFDPLLPHLDGVTKLIVAPDDVLHQVPLDALPWGKGLVGGEYRIELRLALRELLLQPEATSENELFLGVGGIDYGVRNPMPTATTGTGSPTMPARPFFGALDDTAGELEGIVDRLRSRGWTSLHVLEGTAPSRAVLAEQAPLARILHIATHGHVDWPQLELEQPPSGYRDFLNTAPPTRGLAHCWLALAGANRTDDRDGGIVTAEQLASWSLGNCELAILSACDTNAGGYTSGQGVESFQKALRMAGARTTITSLWRAHDRSTKRLMLEFYDRLLTRSPETSIGECLWQAKMVLYEDWYPDAYWAGWVLTGESD